MKSQNTISFSSFHDVTVLASLISVQVQEKVNFIFNHSSCPIYLAPGSDSVEEEVPLQLFAILELGQKIGSRPHRSKYLDWSGC